MNLFVYGFFLGHSGSQLSWKIECDALTDEDVFCLSNMLCMTLWLQNINRFFMIGIPGGGLRFAEQMNRITGVEDAEDVPHIVVDDVWTTGTSMKEWMEKTQSEYGIVVFSRGLLPEKVFCLFQVNWQLSYKGVS